MTFGIDQADRDEVAEECAKTLQWAKQVEGKLLSGPKTQAPAASVTEIETRTSALQVRACVSACARA